MDIKIHCAYDELKNIAEVIPNPRNPNTHPEKQLKLLAKIIEAHGWRSPITVSKRSGFVIRGHGRLMAAQMLGCEVVPVDLQDYASEAEEWADMIFTDPPYNVAYEGGTDEKLTIQNDNMPAEEFNAFLLAAFKCMFDVTKPGGAIYVCHADSAGSDFRGAMAKAGWPIKQCLIWVKNQFTLGRPR